MNANGWQIFVEVPGKAPIELPPGEAVIGRSRSCAVQVAETTVSRQHAVFVVEPGNVRLKDLGSSNGTYVNGRRVDGSQQLADGDRVVVGEAELVIRVLPPLGPGEATQRLSIPPLQAVAAVPAAPAAVPDAAAAVAAAPAPTASAQTAPPPSFRRTPTGVETPPPPVPAPPAAPAATAGAAPSAPAEKKSELLPSIREIDAVPVPQPAPRRAPVVETAAPAGFWIRVAAALLDSIPVMLLAVVGVALAFFVSPNAGLPLTLLQLAYGVWIALAMPALKGTTPAKKLLKLAIVTDATSPGQGLGWSTAFLRLAGHVVCSLTFGLGYLLVAFTAQKQGLHDMIAKTRVVRRA